MKKKNMKRVAAIALVLIAVYAVQCLRGGWILSAQIERVEFRGFESCEVSAKKTVELSRSEIRTLAFHYNLATYAGAVTGQGCPSDFGFAIYLTDGTRINIREANSPRIEVAGLGELYWIKGIGLTAYAQELMEKYDLTNP